MLSDSVGIQMNAAGRVQPSAVQFLSETTKDGVPIIVAAAVPKCRDAKDHHPVAVVALLWIKIIAFTLFHAFAILHGKLFRLGKATFNEVRKQLYRSLLCGLPIQFFSG